MDISTLKHMSRANTHTYPVDRDMVERVVDQLQSEVSLLHEEAWQRTAEECQRDLSLVDFAFDQITGASETASALWAKLGVARGDIEWCRSLRQPSPIRTLPLEILSYIFTLATIDDFFDVVNTQTRSSRPPGHTLTQVSKYWRDIALQTKELWSHPVVVNRHIGRGFPTLSENKADRCIKRLTSAIGLYGSNLTHVSLHCKHFPFRTRLLFDMVLQLRLQLVSLDLVGAGSVVFSEPFEINMPLLRQLFLPSTIPEGVAFKTPKLNKLFLFTHPEATQDIEGLTIPCRGLTHLSLGLPYTTFIDSFFLRINAAHKLPSIFPGACKLVYLHLTCLYLSPSTADINLPKLKVLEIHDGGLKFLRGPWGVSSDTYFPFTISAPALEKFDLAFSVGDKRLLEQGVSQQIAQPFLRTFETIGSFLRNAPLLSQVRILVCSWESFLGHRWDGTNGTSSGQTSQREVYRLSGGGGFFTRLSQAWSELPEKRPIQAMNIMMFKDQPASEVWMDQFIDRYIEEFLDTPFEIDVSYSTLDGIVIGGVYELLGEAGGLPDRCERQVFHAL